MLAEHWPGRRSAIGDSKTYGHPGPAQLDREKAAAATSRMADRVGRQLSRAQSNVVALGIVGEKRGHELPDVAHLVFPARENPAPPHHTPCRTGQPGVR